MDQSLQEDSIPKEKQYPKLVKAQSGYIEMDFFKNADLHTGYFCYNCIYFIKPDHCAIVKNGGPDLHGSQTGIIAPHGVCTLWVENPTEAR